MVIDTSAIMAILQREPEKDKFLVTLALAPSRIISAGTWFETTVVVESWNGPRGAADLDRFIEDSGVEIIPFDTAQAQIAREAYRRYGRGYHRAGLNMGDCFAYALSKHAGEPLLFKGNDFAQTDVTPA
jgi:ribonuclease VapC